MSISIKDISSGLMWDNDNFHFKVNKKNENSKILVEYLNDISIDTLDKDIIILSDFKVLINTKNKKEIENYIMSEFDGFTEYSDGYYVFITGANDLSPSILYDFENNKIFLIHPNFRISEKFIITINDLLRVLNFKKELYNCLF